MKKPTFEELLKLESDMKTALAMAESRLFEYVTHPAGIDSDEKRTLILAIYNLRKSLEPVMSEARLASL